MEQQPTVTDQPQGENQQAPPQGGNQQPPPPQGGYQQPPAAGYQQQPQFKLDYATMTPKQKKSFMLLRPKKMGREPVNLQCPYCQMQVTTVPADITGNCQYIFCCALFCT